MTFKWIVLTWFAIFRKIIWHKPRRNKNMCPLTAGIHSVALSLSARPVSQTSCSSSPCTLSEKQTCLEGKSWQGSVAGISQQKQHISSIFHATTKLQQLTFPPGDFHHNHFSVRSQNMGLNSSNLSHLHKSVVSDSEESHFFFLLCVNQFTLKGFKPAWMFSPYWPEHVWISEVRTIMCVYQVLLVAVLPYSDIKYHSVRKTICVITLQ